MVIIGRNEGARLGRCLRSIDAVFDGPRVYVDSASGDDSVDVARAHGACTVALDPAIPLSAGRARNEGFAALIEAHPELELVQFIDGDCELLHGWLDAAREYLDEHPGVAVVSGRLFERHREHSLYNRLCDLEWKARPGPARSCGGIFLARAEAFAAVRGFIPEMIAGEEPNLCFRLTGAGWEVHRLPVDMATHDADMRTFSQWLIRCARGGYATLDNGVRQLRAGRVAGTREMWRNPWWGAVVPGAAAGGAWITGGASLWLLALYPLWMIRIAVARRLAFADAWRDALLYGGFCLLGRFPALAGQALYISRHIGSRPVRIIEYKQRRQSANHES